MILPTFPASTITDPDETPDYKTCQRIARSLNHFATLTPEQQVQLQVACNQKSDLFPFLEEAFLGPIKKALDETTYLTARGFLSPTPSLKVSN